MAQGNFRNLLWLRRQLAWRQWTGQRGRWVGAAVSLLLLGPLIWQTAVASSTFYATHSPEESAPLLVGIFVLLWLIWLVTPVFATSLNAAFDISRLLIYPFQAKEWVAATFAGTIFDLSTYLVLPLFAATVLGWGSGRGQLGSALVALAACLLCFGHMVLIGQLVVTISGRVFHGRLRTFLLALFLLLGLGAMVSLVAAGTLQQAWTTVWQGWLLQDPMRWLRWLPTGAAATAVGEAAKANWPAVWFWLGVTVGWLCLIAWLWWRSLIRLTTGRGHLIQIGKAINQSQAPTKQSSNLQSPIPNLLPTAVIIIARNEWLLFWRTEGRRSGLIVIALSPILLLGALLWADRLDFTAVNWLQIAPLFAIILLWVSSLNMFGWEQHGITTLLLLPVPRRDILWGKGLALWLAAAVPLLVWVAGLLVITRSAALLGAGLAGLLTTVVILPVSLWSSLRFPMRIDPDEAEKRSAFSMTRGGCGTAVAGMLLPFFLWLAGLPILWGITWLQAVKPSTWFMPLLFLSCYIGIMLFGGISLTTDLFIARESDMWQALQLRGQGRENA